MVSIKTKRLSPFWRSRDFCSSKIYIMSQREITETVKSQLLSNPWFRYLIRMRDWRNDRWWKTRGLIYPVHLYKQTSCTVELKPPFALLSSTQLRHQGYGGKTTTFTNGFFRSHYWNESVFVKFCLSKPRRYYSTSLKRKNLASIYSLYSFIRHWNESEWSTIAFNYMYLLQSFP